MSDIQGGDFDSGFLSGAISSLVSSNVINKAGAKGWSANKTAAVTIAAGGLSGGISSVIAGGNFWAGARQGLITSGLNHVTHDVFSKPDKDPPTKRQKLTRAIDVTDQILESNEAISALDEYIANATKGSPHKILGKMGKISGNVTSITSVAVSGLEYSNGDISGLELTFDLGTTAASIWVSAVVGAELGGPYGFVAGAAIGGISEFVVKPLYKNYVRPNIVVPAQKTYNRWWTSAYNKLIYSMTSFYR